MKVEDVTEDNYQTQFRFFVEHPIGQHLRRYARGNSCNARCGDGRSSVTRERNCAGADTGQRIQTATNGRSLG
ncbi:MAG TPA: hypothetical protein VN696_00640, partial [Pyrinomonadaceae bacterium]|nr:hypothetical protein [Pyrinomonadaceae bacterium]